MEASGQWTAKRSPKKTEHAWFGTFFLSASLRKERLHSICQHCGHSEELLTPDEVHAIEEDLRLLGDTH
jgi:hypothetical protein